MSSHDLGDPRLFFRRVFQHCQQPTRDKIYADSVDCIIIQRILLSFIRVSTTASVSQFSLSLPALFPSQVRLVLFHRVAAVAASAYNYNINNVPYSGVVVK